MDPSSQKLLWGPNKDVKQRRETDRGGRKAANLGWGEEKAVVWESRGEERATKGGGVEEWGAPFFQQSERGNRGKRRRRRRRRRRRGVIKSWGRREKSRLDMGLCAVLLICLSQAELGRVWAQEHEGKPPFFNVNNKYTQVFTCILILTPFWLPFFRTDCQVLREPLKIWTEVKRNYLATNSRLEKNVLWALFMGGCCMCVCSVCAYACVKLTGPLTFLSVSHRKHMKDGVQVWIFLGCHSKTSVFPICLVFICLKNTDHVIVNPAF